VCGVSVKKEYGGENQRLFRSLAYGL